MRKVAQALGYEAMSLYHHVANKDDLLEGMLDHVMGGIVMPPADVEWKTGIRSLAVSTHEVLLDHPWAVEMLTNVFPGPHRFAHMERLLELLAAADLDEHLADLGFHAVNMYVAGYTQQVLGYRTSMERWSELETRFDSEVPASRYPLMVAHKHYHDDVAAERASRPDEFGFVLDLILDGLERASRPD